MYCKAHYKELSLKQSVSQMTKNYKSQKFVHKTARELGKATVSRYAIIKTNMPLDGHNALYFKDSVWVTDRTKVFQVQQGMFTEQSSLFSKSATVFGLCRHAFDDNIMFILISTGILQYDGKNLTTVMEFTTAPYSVIRQVVHAPPCIFVAGGNYNLYGLSDVGVVGINLETKSVVPTNFNFQHVRTLAYDTAMQELYMCNMYEMFKGNLEMKKKTRINCTDKLRFSVYSWMDWLHKNEILLLATSLIDQGYDYFLVDIKSNVLYQLDLNPSDQLIYSNQAMCVLPEGRYWTHGGCYIAKTYPFIRQFRVVEYQSWFTMARIMVQLRKQSKYTDLVVDTN